MVPTVPGPWSRRYRSAVTVETDSKFSAYAPEPPQQGPVRHLHHMACRRNSRATQARCGILRLVKEIKREPEKEVS